MANLFGFNIGTNYKGILNIGSVINTPLDTTLRAVTDGMGVASPLQLSTTQVIYSGNILNTLVFGAFNSTRTDGIGFFNANSDATPVWSLRAGNDCRIQMYSNEITLRAGGTSIAKFFPTSVGIGNPDAYTPSARLHVRGDGTNPIARFENGSNNASFQINDSGIATFVTPANAGVECFRILQNANLTFTSGTYSGFNYSMNGDFRPASGSPNFRPLLISYTLNAQGANTGTATGIFLNATETALNGMAHNLMDLQVGGNSVFRVTNGGTATFQRGIIGTIQNNAINNFNNTVTMFTLGATSTMYGGALLQLGGTTNAFPALKRNGAALEVRLADDSAFANVAANNITTSGLGLSYDLGVGINIGSITAGNGWRVNLIDNGSNIYGSFGTAGNVLTDRSGSGRAVLTASSILDLQSTTKGFLPPRMTTAQRDLIATPAAGLMIFNTSTSRPNFFDGSVWVAL